MAVDDDHGGSVGLDDFVSIFMPFVQHNRDVADVPGEELDASAAAVQPNAETRCAVLWLCCLRTLHSHPTPCCLYSTPVIISSNKYCAVVLCCRLQLAVALNEAFHQIDHDQKDAISFQDIVDYIVTLSSVQLVASHQHCY